MPTTEPVDLSTPENIQKAYDALTKEEEDCKNELDLLLSRQCQIDAKVRGITKALPNLQAIQSDSVQLSQMMTFISTLAENVSAKVRQLDNARGRVSECQQRVHDLLDLQLCSDGVTAALGAGDCERAAAHVHRFLAMDHASLQRTAGDMRRDCATVSSSVTLLHAAAGQLRDAVSAQFDEAVSADDLASVERFFKLFPLLDMHDRGLDKFSAYLCSKAFELPGKGIVQLYAEIREAPSTHFKPHFKKAKSLRSWWAMLGDLSTEKESLAKLEATSKKNLEAAQKTSASDKRANVIYADSLTLLFEEIARVVEIHQPLVETYYGFGRLHQVAFALQHECDRQSRAVLAEFARQRQTERRVALVAEAERAAPASATAPAAPLVDPRELDVLLGEIAIMHARYRLYLRFIQRRVTNDVETGLAEGEARRARLEQLERTLGGSELCRGMQELLGTYLQLERHYMLRSVAKAVAVDTIEPAALQSSMVDDVFFIVRKCIRRAASTGDLDGVCAVINHACAALETELCRAIRAQLRLGFPSGYLDLTQAYHVVMQGRLSHTASDSQNARTMFLVYLNNAEVSGDYVTELCRGLCREIPCASARDRAKLDSCLAGLGSVTASMGALVDLGLQQLRVSAVRPRVAPWVDAFLALSHSLSEEEFSSYEANEPFTRSLIANLDGLLAEFKGTLTAANHDALVGILVSEVTTQMERVILKSEFNRLGGLALDKEVRSLVSYVNSVTSWSVRDKFARLTQIATVLNLERAAEIADYWGAEAGAAPWRLTAKEVRQFMALRTDFRSEDIKRLKL